VRWKRTTRGPNAAGESFREKHSELEPEELSRMEQHLVQQVG
jgi:hypothetical protein